MLVNRILVEEIPNDAAPDFFEIRKHFTQQPDVVHRQQCVVYSLAILHHLQDQAARFRMIGKKTIGGDHTLPNGGQGCGIEPGRLSAACGLLRWSSRCRMAARVADSSRAFLRCASANALIMSNGSEKSEGMLTRLGLPMTASSQRLAWRATSPAFRK